MIGSQFCAQFSQLRFACASSGRSNSIVRSSLECGCSQWVEGRERDGFEIRGRGNPLLSLICLVQVSLFYSACIFFYCYLPMSNLYLAGGFILPFFNLVCLVCLQGAHSRISCFFSFLFTRYRGVLLVLVKLEYVFRSDFPACLEYTFWSEFPVCLELPFTGGSLLDSLFTLFPARDLSFWSTPPCVYTCLLFLVENKE